jgi:hypothetical protein
MAALRSRRRCIPLALRYEAAAGRLVRWESMQKLLVLQSLWSMQNLRSKPERGVAETVAQIAGAGFDGICALWDTHANARATAMAARDHGLIVEGLILPTSVDALQPALEWGTEFGVHHINIQPNVRPQAFSDAIATLEGWQRLAEEVDFPINIETHRGRITNDLLVMLDILEAMPDLRLTADISHYVVGREIELPLSEESDKRIKAVLGRAEAYHGRVATSEQVQVPLSFDYAKPWIEMFKDWWRYGFEDWRRRSPADAALTFVCELGPQPYAIAGADGLDLTDRWQESLMLKDIAAQCWQG